MLVGGTLVAYPFLLREPGIVVNGFLEPP